MGVQLGAVFGPMEQWTPPIVSESELLAARLDLVLGALADLSGTLRALPAPQVHLEAPDLSAIVTAVNSLKPSVGADEIAAAVRETLTPSLLPAEPADDSTLRALADTLTKLEFRLRAAGNHTAAVTFPSDPARQVGHVTVDSAPAVTGTVAVSNFPTSQPVRDYFTDGEQLADQTGAGAVLTFTFSAPVQLVFVRANGGIVRASASTTPTASLGIYCGDGESTAIPRQVTTLSVYAPAAAVVSVWGFRY